MLSVIVLAGGQSLRMGQDKALILVNEVPLLQRTCEIGLQCASTVLVVTSRIWQYQEIVPAKCQFVREVPIEGEVSSHGPLVGFAQGLAYVQTPWVLLLACDLPYLQAEILRRWQQQLPDGGHELALLPHTDKGWDPLCGFYHRDCLTALLSFTQAGGRSFQNWLKQLPVKAITFSPSPEIYQQEAQMLFNCNTVDDLRFLQGHGH